VPKDLIWYQSSSVLLSDARVGRRLGAAGDTEEGEEENP
jgi:hypothetical protein